MGLYGEQVLPRIINVACGMKAVAPLRKRVCEGLEGEVVEIGFGSGLNVPFYPEAVTRVAAVEPADLGWKLAGKRLREASIPVQRSRAWTAESLPFANDSFDAALSTWTLCTIPDVAAALVRGAARPQSPECTPALRRARPGPGRARRAAGNIGSSLCRSGSSEAATSRARPSTC